MSILRSVPLCLALTFLFTLTACQADSAKSPAVKTEPPAKLAGDRRKGSGTDFDQPDGSRGKTPGHSH